MASTGSADILDLDGWTTEQQLADLLLASESRSLWCGESLLLLADSEDGQAAAATETSDSEQPQLANCAWYPCLNAPTITNFYACAKSQLYSRSDPLLLLKPRPVLVCVSDASALQSLVTLVAKDAPLLSARPLIQASFDLVRAFTCVYRCDRGGGGAAAGLDNHSVTLLRADFDRNGDLAGVRYDIPWLMGYGVLGHRELDFSAYAFFNSLMDNATEETRVEYFLDDPALRAVVAYADADSVPAAMKRLNVIRSLSDTFGFTDGSLDLVHRCASAALNLKLVRVVPDVRKPKKCVQFERHENLERAAHLLGLETESLRRELTIKYEVLRDGHKKALRNRSAPECNVAIDAMICGLYRLLVRCVVTRLNERLAVGRLCCRGGSSESGEASSSVSVSGRLTILTAPADSLRCLQQLTSTSSSSPPSSPSRDAFDFEVNFLGDLLGCLRARLTAETPLRLLAREAVHLSPEVLAERGYPQPSSDGGGGGGASWPGPPTALIDSYRSAGSAKSPTVLGVAFGLASESKKLPVPSAAYQLTKVKNGGGGHSEWLLEVRHWLGSRVYRRDSLAAFAPSEAEAAGVFLARSSQLLAQQQQTVTAPWWATLVSHTLTQLTQLLTEPAQLELSSTAAAADATTSGGETGAAAAAAAAKLLFVERVPIFGGGSGGDGSPAASAVQALRACQLVGARACQLFQCCAARHRMLAAFGEAVLPYTAEGLGACQEAGADGGDDVGECSQACLRSGHYLKRVAKRLYDAPLLIGRKLIFCHYRHLLGLYRAQAGLHGSAILLQSHARGLAARRVFHRLAAKARAYRAELRVAMDAALSDGAQDRFYGVCVRSLTEDVWRANWSLIESHVPAAGAAAVSSAVVGRGSRLSGGFGGSSSSGSASLLPAAYWAELLAFSRGRLFAQVPLSGRRVLVRCGGGGGGGGDGDGDEADGDGDEADGADEAAGDGEPSALEVDQVVDLDAGQCESPAVASGRRLLVLEHGPDRSVLLTRLSADCPAWCWGYWRPEVVGCGRRAVELGADYPVGEPVPVFDASEWVAHLCSRLQAGDCRVRDTRLRCAVPLVVGSAGGSVGLLSAAPLWLLAVNHAELRHLAAVGGGPLGAEVAEALTNYRRFGNLDPTRRRWAKVHSSQAPMEMASLLTRLEMLDPAHRAADEAARLKLLSNSMGGQSASDSAGRRVQWAKQRATEPVDH